MRNTLFLFALTLPLIGHGQTPSDTLSRFLEPAAVTAVRATERAPFAAETLDAIRAVKAHGREARFATAFGAEVDRSAALALREMRWHKVWNGSNLVMGAAGALLFYHLGEAQTDSLLAPYFFEDVPTVLYLRD